MRFIGIVGSRERNGQDDLKAVYAAFKEVYESGDMIVSGGCPQGGDAFAEWIAKKEQVPITIIYAQWNKLGKSAGFARNGDIADASDILIACVSPDRMGGTEDTIRKFANKGELILV